jgi:hypothetical protein
MTNSPGYVVAPEREFGWTVVFYQPNDDGQRVAKPVKFRFRQLRNSAFTQLQRELREIGKTAETEEAALAAAAEGYERIVLGWDSAAMAGPDKTPVEYSRDALIKVLDQPHAGTAIMDAYNEAISPPGREERRRGN